LDDYRAFRDAGADRYLLKHETINPRLYTAVHPGHRLSRRLRILETLRKLGYQVGVGIIVGLPGQTLDDLAEDIMFMRDWMPGMAGIGPFIPQQHTPFRDHVPGDCATVLRVLALTRIMTKTVLLPVTTALSSIAPGEGLPCALKAGANVIMVNFTPREKRRQYAIYDNKAAVGFKKACTVIRQVRRVISLERGDAFSAEGK
jgi:Biotin synthase and related enzymes